MDLYLDTADRTELEPLLATGLFRGVTTNPLILDNGVYVQDLNSNVYAIDLEDGEQLWKATYDIEQLGPNGVAVGYGMGASEDHRLASAHAHINLLGWVSMFLYGLFYRAFPAAATGLLPKLHFWSAVLGFVIMVPALAIKLLGAPGLEGVSTIGLIAGPTLIVLGMILLLPARRPSAQTPDTTNTKETAQ